MEETRSSTQDSYAMDTDSQPAAKRRKLGQAKPAFSSSQQKPAEPSFADVLQRLKEEAGEAKGEYDFFMYAQLPLTPL